MSLLRRSRASACLAAILALAATAQARVRHHPVDRSGRTQTGTASFYARRDAGKTTASGSTYKPQRLTAASPTLPLGAKAKVTNLENGKSVNVTVTDRGPFAKHRILDVSSKAATKLGLKKDGVATVKVKPLKEPPRDETREAAAARPRRVPRG